MQHSYGLLHGYTTITSYFGKRTAPTTGASTYHSGIDIAAPTRNYTNCYNKWPNLIFRF